MKNILEIENLTKMYNKEAGIKNVNLSLREGEVIGIVGPSGSGKSTLIKSILNYVNITDGKITLFDTDLHKNYEEIMSIIGYVPDDFIDFPDTTSKDLLNYCAKFYNGNYEKDIDKLSIIFDLNLNKKIFELSSGGKKKLNLIQAFFHNPKLLFLDEPTNFLDEFTINTLLNYLKRLKANYKSMLICSHELSFLNAICDDIYLLTDHNLIKLDRSIFKSNYKKVILKTSVYYEYKTFMIKGVDKLDMQDDTVSFIYKGDIAYLLKYLSSLNILDISILNPEASEILGSLYYDNK